MDKEPKQERSTAEYAKFEPAKKKSRRPKLKLPAFNWKKPAKYLVILAVLAVAAAGAYKFFFQPEPKTPNSQASNQAQQSNNAPGGGITTATEHYSSTQFALEFDYPSDWKVDESTTGRLTATSPELALTDKDGRTVTGQIILTIRNKQQPLPEFDEGNALAARESEKVSYTKPSPNQRGETYISLLRWASSTASEGDFDGVYITGNNGYQKDQAAPKADFAGVDPLISVTYLKGGAPLTVADNMWDDPDYSAPLRSMLQSLMIR